MDNLKWMDFTQTLDPYADLDRLKNNTNYLKTLIENLDIEDLRPRIDKIEENITNLVTSSTTNTNDIADIKKQLISINSEIQLKANQSDLDKANDLIKTKQDLLDTKNAGTNITITKDKDGITPLINAQVNIPDIDGNKIHGTINGQDKVLVEAITNNEQAISSNKSLINKNTTDIQTKANQTDLDKANKTLSDLDTYTKQIPYVNLKGETINTNLHDLGYEEIPNDLKLLQTKTDNGLQTSDKTIVGGINEILHKLINFSIKAYDNPKHLSDLNLKNHNIIFGYTPDADINGAVYLGNDYKYTKGQVSFCYVDIHGSRAYINLGGSNPDLIISNGDFTLVVLSWN